MEKFEPKYGVYEKRYSLMATIYYFELGRILDRFYEYSIDYKLVPTSIDFGVKDIFTSFGTDKAVELHVWEGHVNRVEVMGLLDSVLPPKTETEITR
jgi:hypothetical protein